MLYLDIFSGISGDMLLGALIDLGVDKSVIEQELKKLPVSGYHLHGSHAMKAGISGIKVDIHPDGTETEGGPMKSGHSHSHHAETHAHHHQHHHPHDHHACHDHGDPHGRDLAHDLHHTDGRTEESQDVGGLVNISPYEASHHGRDFNAIRKLIEASTLSAWVKAKAVNVFHRIAVAEGKIHGKPLESVHFHEVGALDSIIDIVGGVVALEQLGCPRVRSGPVVEGRGWIDCAHGRYPLPAMATLEILGARGIPVSQVDEPHELVTPTGAAMLAEFAESFAPMTNLVAERVGYGLGTRDHVTRPNVLRAILSSGEGETDYDWERDTVTVLETNLDDSSGEVVGYIAEKAMEAGALDVYTVPIQMKKSRPACVLAVMCRPGDADALTALVLRETTAFGVRRTTWERCKLARETVTVPTRYGEIAVKIGRLNGVQVQVAPEFESCRRVAEGTGMPLRRVLEDAVKAWREMGGAHDG